MAARRRVDWIASAKKDYDEFPDAVKYVMGFALGLIQDGEMPDGVISLVGIAPPVFEIREQHACSIASMSFMHSRRKARAECKRRYRISH